MLNLIFTGKPEILYKIVNNNEVCPEVTYCAYNELMCKKIKDAGKNVFKTAVINIFNPVCIISKI